MLRLLAALSLLALPANLLAAGTTTALVVDPDGSLFAMNAGRIVVIDPVNGLQRVLRERLCTCVGLICAFVERALDLGVAPRGLAIEPEVVPAFGDRRRLDLQTATVDVFTPAVSTLWKSPSSLRTRGIDHRYGVTVVAIQSGGCSPASAGVYYATNPPQPLTEGGYLRCPEDVVIDPLRESTIWSSDRSTTGVPGRVIRLDFDGTHWVQAVLTALPEDGAVGPIAVSPR